MKRTLCLFLALILAVGICFSAPVTITASAAESVSYVDYTWNEESKTLSSEMKSVDTYTEITSTTTEMTSGWYVVNGEVTVAERMTATGEVHLILADGAHLTASLGITVNEGNSLYIYGQSSDENTMGKLTATTTSSDAAIGSLYVNHAGTIVINGGNINASTSGYGAGIGSGAKYGGYQITINAGVVTATSSKPSAAIGSGNNGGYGVRGTVHSICINGGVVNATQTADGGAAIGGGNLFDGGDITITGGTVTATNKGAGAAIGGGMYGSGGNITITGGNVSATYTHSFRYGAAIGAGYYGESAGNILITGGTVTATSNRGCGIGVYNGDNGRIVILGGTVNASGSGTVHINAGASGSMMLVDGTTVTISGDFTLQTDFVLPEGYTLEISEGATLTIPEGVTLTLPEEYTLISNGTVNAVGTVNCITHKYVEGVCICGFECNHVGGTPTCTATAVCTTCGTAYGEVDPTNHNWENGVCTYGCNTIHEPHDWSGKDGICTVCGATCTHTGGEATCTEKAVCTICGASYGELGGHTAEPTYAPNAEDSTKHDVTYSCCGTVVIEYHDYNDEKICTKCGNPGAWFTGTKVNDDFSVTFFVECDYHYFVPWDQLQIEVYNGDQLVEWLDNIAYDVQQGYYATMTALNPDCKGITLTADLTIQGIFTEHEKTSTTVEVKNPNNHSGVLGDPVLTEDGEQHVKKWSCCDAEVTEAHTPDANDYTVATDGTHSFKCSGCGTVITEPHNFENAAHQCACGERETYSITCTETGSNGGAVRLTNTEPAIHGQTYTTQLLMPQDIQGWYTDVIKVSVNGEELVKDTDYTYDLQTVRLTVDGEKVTGNIEITYQINAAVTFVLNGGDLEPSLKNKLTLGGLNIIDDKITMPLAYGMPSSFNNLNNTFIREGYICTGLKNGEQDADMTAPVVNCTLSVQWQQCTHNTIDENDVCTTCGGKHCGETETDKVVWFYDASDDGNDETLPILTITGTGAMADYGLNNTPWENYKSSITQINIENGVTTIGECAFKDCTALTSVIIPDSVTTIGVFAFRDCIKLTSVTIPDSVTTIGDGAFMDCTALTSVTIPESVTTIGETAFYGCTALETVIITGFNTAIGEQAFELCTNVTLLVKESSVAHAYALEKNIKYITYVGGSGELGKLTFTPIYEEADNENSEITGYSVTTRDTSISGALTIPSKYNGYRVTAIGDNAFSNCTSLTSVEILPDSVETIGEDAFKDCSENLLLLVEGGSALERYAEEEEIVYISFEITDEIVRKAQVVDCSRLITGSLTIPSKYNDYSVTAIDNSAFVTCTELTSVIIPKSVTTIGENAFANCDTLNSVEILGNVTEISARTFEYCMSLSSITIPESVTEIGENAFAYCNNLSSITIPEGVTTIGDKAFSNCTKLETVTIGKSVTTIGEGTFAYCNNLSSVIIPNSVTTIGKNAFDSCTNLESVTIGENVGKIDDGTFGNCTSLKTIKIPDSVKTIGAYAFKDCSSLKEIAIPESVETIGANAFRTCEKLTEIIIPKSVTSIDAEAFYNCGNLKYIFFEGKEDSQKKLGDALVTNAKIHYGSSTHTFNENYTVDTEPTCTEKGSESQHCKYCDLTQNERPVKENGHTSVNGGKIDVHTKCDVCGVTLSAEHEFTKTVIKAPTCTSQGVETWACECGYSETNNVEESDHNFVNHDGKVATCTEDGYYPYQTCTTCDYTTYHVDPAKGHDIVIDKAVEATCTKTGLTEGSHCTRCNDKTVKQNVIPTKAHTEVTVTGKAATCTATGLTDGKKCSVCGAVTVAQQVISATGHTITVVGKKDATCTVDGYTGDAYCSVCKTTTVKGTVVKATGHKEVVIPEVAPTYTTVGKTEGKKCSVCDTITVAQKDVAKLILAVPTVTIKNTAKGINVSWNKVNGAESYIVYRRTYNEKTKKWSSWSRLKTGVTATSYTDTTVKLGTKYRYTVKSVNGDVASKYISTSTLKYNVAPTVKVANASNGVKVSWSTVANATGYTVYSSTYNTKTKKWSGWKNRGTAKATATSWVDKNATKSGAYYKYTVRACNGKDIKSSYNKDGVKTLFLATPTVKIANNAKGVKVTWNKITGSKGYIIYRSEINNGKWSNWKNMGTVKNTILSWVDNNAQSGTTYRYTVRAVNGNYKSAYKASGSLIFLSQPTVKVANASNGIKVSWNKVDGVTGYTVYSSTYDAKTKKWSSWKNRGTAKANKTSWVDKNVKSGVTYKYTVRAVNGKTRSTYVSSSALLYLAQPTVTVKATSNGINVSWTQCAGSNGYTVYRSELVNGEWSNWTNMGTAKSDKKSWTDKKAKKGVTYKYTVRAVNGKVKSSYKSSSSITK